MQLGERTLIMGVINLTPDSFSDGGRFNEPDRAYARALELEEAGADIIDIGAESTRPGSKRISADEEWQRLVPVLKRLRGNLRAPISLDTYKAEIAERALEYGVEIFNDPSGLTFDPGLAKVAANGNAGLILNHMRGQPETWAKLPPMQDPVGTVAKELDATVSRARHAGVDKARIVIDPGLGFGKRKEQNAEILAHLQKLAALDYPILVGASRKSFLAQATEADTAFATAAAVAAAVLNGAHIVRVHDVKEMQSVILVADEIAHAAGISRVPAVEERVSVSRAGSLANRGTGVFEEERPKPTRPPLSKPAPKVVEVPLAAALPFVVEPEATVDADVVPDDVSVTGEAEHEAPPAPPKRVAAKPAFKPETRPPARVPGKFSADREAARGGFKPPVRRPSFDRKPDSDRERRPSFDRDRKPDSDRERRPAARDRDFRPGGPPSGPRKPPFKRDGERPSFERGESSGPPRREFRPGGPGTGRPPSRPGGDRPPFKPGGPKRSFEPRTGPPRGAAPRSGPPRGGPPRSGPPGGGKSGPPKRPFRKRP